MKLGDYVKRRLEGHDCTTTVNPSSRKLRLAVRHLYVASTFALALMMFLPLPTHAQSFATQPGEALMLQNLAAQGWVSRFFDPSSQVWTFFMTFQPDLERWRFAAQTGGYNISASDDSVALMPLPNNYYEWSPVVARSLTSGCSPLWYCSTLPRNIWNVERVPGYSQHHFLLRSAHNASMCIGAGWNAGQQISELRLQYCNQYDARQLFAIWNPSTGQFK